MKPKLFSLFISIIFISCNTRYAYRTKVKINGDKPIAKKEFSASIDSKIEASIERPYQAIDNNKLRNMEVYSDSLQINNERKYSPVKESFLKLKSSVTDTSNAKYTIPPKTKRLNTLAAILFRWWQLFYT